MQQEYCNVTATLVRAMKEIFRDMIFQNVMIWIDDIVISSTTYKEHVQAFRRVPQRL